MYVLGLHEDKVEGAVEERVDEVGEAQVKDEQVGDGTHPSVSCVCTGGQPST